MDDGRPYLVLEFVDGTTITEYCRAKELGVRDRVRLFVHVIRALHHAHSHLVVHRDIKPSNILVSRQGRVSLLDFGIAKLLEPGAVPGASTLTRTGVSLLTPGYCSPEQQAGESVTTASDIYQAGAVLFEVLTGKRPLLATADESGLRPGRSPGKRRESATECGDLDAIVAKAMHVDPSQRYASASEFEADLQRYLDGRPVIARPDTLRYRLVSFSKRRPWVLPGIAIGVFMAIGYIVTLINYNAQLRIEEQRATAAQAFLCHPMIVRQNKWRACRFGTQAPLVNSFTFEVETVGDIVRRLNSELEPTAADLGCLDYLRKTQQIADSDGWAFRQRMMQETTSPREMVDQLTWNSRIKTSQTPVFPCD